MISSISKILLSFQASLLNFLLGHLLFTSGLLVALGAGLAWRPRFIKKWGPWLLFVLILVLELKVLTGVAQVTVERFDHRHSSRYATKGTPVGGDTVQYSPTVSYEEVTTREETLTFSDQLFEVAGLAALPGWNGRGSYSSNVVDVTDTLEKTPFATVVRRHLTFTHFRPIKLDASLINLDLSFLSGSVAYQTDFQAEYRFRNPLDQRAKIRFTFPLPADSGTLSDFQMTLNGETVPQRFERELGAKEEAVVKVSYRNKGRRSWTYTPTRRRAPIDHLKLTLTSDNSRIKFRRDSLFPTSQNSESWCWELDGVITSQDISLFFPASSHRESLKRYLNFAPLALLLFAGGLVAILSTPGRSAAALSVYAAGFVMTSYLWSYFGFAPAIVAGALCGCVAAARILHPAGRQLSLVAGLASLAFCLSPFTGLLLACLGLVVLVRLTGHS